MEKNIIIKEESEEMDYGELLGIDVTVVELGIIETILITKELFEVLSLVISNISVVNVPIMGQEVHTEKELHIEKELYSVDIEEASQYWGTEPIERGYFYHMLQGAIINNNFNIDLEEEICNIEQKLIYSV